MISVTTSIGGLLSGFRTCLAMPMFLAAFLCMTPAPVAEAQTQSIPNFWHPGERLVKPDLSGVQRLRFLTTTDFPPFNFIDRKKRLTGFHVDLARAICAELGILQKCQIQALPWDELENAMANGNGDAIIAGLEITDETRQRYEFSRPFLQVPARFVARRESGIAEPMNRAVRRFETGVVAGSRHAEWLEKTFDGARIEKFPDRDAALKALQEEKIDLVFSDAVVLSFWLASQSAKDCCVFAGGPYLSPAHFGAGFAIAFPKGRGELAGAADYALSQLNDKGVFAELYLRYFPISLY